MKAEEWFGFFCHHSSAKEAPIKRLASMHVAAMENEGWFFPQIQGGPQMISEGL
jgi:hypothetical protein